MKLFKLSLVSQILIATVTAVILALIAPGIAAYFNILGQLFVSLLKSIAPLLIFVLVLSSIANQQTHSSEHSIFTTLCLYFIATVTAALISVTVSGLFPVNLQLGHVATGNPPENVGEVLSFIALSMVDNPVKALTQGNFLGCLTWAVLLGIGFRQAPSSFKGHLDTLAAGFTYVVGLIIRLAPLGIFGIVTNTVVSTGVDVLLNYAHIAAILVLSMAIMALLINPMIVWIMTRTNPFPIIFICLKESGITAFFTRSSAANIPVNLKLCEKLNIPAPLYSISIPVGATINMTGAAITITTLTMAAAHTLGMQISFSQAMVLSIVSALAACGASGVPSGSLLLIPLACSLFGIPYETAMQVVAIGFVISVIQDSLETALNSSSDVVYTYAAAAAKKSTIP